MKPVYLAGPVSGLTYEEARYGWRAHMHHALNNAGIPTVSPQRFYGHMKGTGTIESVCGSTHPLTTPKGITTRDRYDVLNSGLVFCNLLGAVRVSIGSVIEIAWADIARVPVVLVSEPGNMHSHDMLTDIVGFRVATLEEGLQIVKAIMLPGL